MPKLDPYCTVPAIDGETKLFVRRTIAERGNNLSLAFGLSGFRLVVCRPPHKITHSGLSIRMSPPDRQPLSIL